jgi:hypothetical protein
MDFENMLLLIETIGLLDEFFNDNAHSSAMWLTTKNPLLGNSKPITFFLMGRGIKVFRFAHNAIGENKL